MIVFTVQGKEWYLDDVCTCRHHSYIATPSPCRHVTWTQVKWVNECTIFKAWFTSMHSVKPNGLLYRWEMEEKGCIFLKQQQQGNCMMLLHHAISHTWMNGGPAGLFKRAAHFVCMWFASVGTGVIPALANNQHKCKPSLTQYIFMCKILYSKYHP